MTGVHDRTRTLARRVREVDGASHTQRAPRTLHLDCGVKRLAHKLDDGAPPP